MGKRAVLFPGQGAQKVGMGKDLYESIPEVKSLYARASEAAGLDLAKLCFEGPDAELNDTAVCQAAILTTSIAALEALKIRKGADAAKADMCAGLSLGEYTALVYAGSLRFEDGVRLVRQRGLFMNEAGRINPGTMMTLLGVERAAVMELIDACRGKGTLVAANFNGPGQIVLSGSIDGIDAAEAEAKNRGIKRAIRLTVSGAFHSPLMEPAAEKLRAELAKTEIAAPQVPLVSNVSAQYVRTADEVRQLLARQLTSPVLWEDSMRFMIGEGMTDAVEIGPGRVLSGLLGKIDKNVATKNIGSTTDLDA